jgi:tetrahydromethanopterin S-methyltransferase subunit F
MTEEEEVSTLPPPDQTNPLNHTLSPILPLSCPLCECSCPTTIPPSIPLPPKTQQEVLDDESSFTYEEISDNRVGVFRQEKELDIEYSFDQVASSTEDISVLEQISARQQYSLSTLVWTGVACFVAGMVISVALGFLCLRMCRHDTTASVTSSNVSLVKPSPIEKPVHMDSGYNTPTATTQQNNATNNNKNSINMLVNVQPKTATVKSARTMINCTNTLQKVKRIYL